MYQNIGTINDGLYLAAAGLCLNHEYGSLAWRKAMADTLRLLRKNVRTLQAD